jgi:hypothetical protein
VCAPPPPPTHTHTTPPPPPPRPTAARCAAHSFVGEVTRVAPTLLTSLVSSGYIPVVATVATDDRGQALNVNADTAAGEVRGCRVETARDSQRQLRLCGCRVWVGVGGWGGGGGERGAHPVHMRVCSFV